MASSIAMGNAFVFLNAVLISSFQKWFLFFESMPIFQMLLKRAFISVSPARVFALGL